MPDFFMNMPQNITITTSGPIGTGRYAIRVYNATIWAGANSSGSLALHNNYAASTSAAANLVVNLSLSTSNNAVNTQMYDCHYGLRFPLGCYAFLSGNSGLQAACITFVEEQL